MRSLLAGFVVASVSLLAACDGEPAAPSHGSTPSPTRQTSPTTDPCPPPPSPGTIPADFPDIDLPSEAQVVEPPSVLEGEQRVDLLVPQSVKATQREMAGAVRRAGFRLLGQDYEGFEAEVYFKAGTRSGLVMILQGCGDDDTVVAIRLFGSD